MHQTRQFTKRRPQSPLLNQQQTVDGLQINKPALPRSGLAIQSNAPIHSTATSITRSFTPTTTTVEHAQHIHPEPNQYHYHDTSASAVPVKANVPHGDQKHFNEPHHGHDHHGHDHHGHDHHGHDHHGHDLHTHDHHNHNHHEHGHAHNHSHHSHNHNHNPNHDHDHHHGHDHAHHQHSNFPQVYTQPLPSYASIFASLIPFQKALFTCFMGHFFIGIILWWLGVSRESLSITGFSYLVLFDSFGTLNNFVSSVLHVNPAFTTMSTKRPFGVKRFEVVLALANTIFLLFGTMYTTKESLEHLLLEEHHGGSGDHHGNSGFPLGLLVMLLVAIAASFASSIKLKNHDNLVNLTKRSSQFQHEYIQNTPLDALVKNIYSLSIVSAGSIVFVFQLFGLSSPSVDKFLAFAEASLMLYLGAPTATALAKVLLQTMPDAMTHAIDHQLRSIQQIPSVVSVDKVHFWQNAYGKCIGTLEVHTRPDADEDAVINASFDILEPLVKENEGELTISIIKMK
ncbi:hypothetical protein HMPREF1544_10271 [Mucor circinelloides 1006PhL]|uniref:Cation efflux protein transmembrane domain-containing protein n=1 Tax=Mucor circinelloides f. circinelloides (strain 1006PhL) TaxID=1220926 RepID=S2JKE0_MUCC1|nr:hypothetical protein HMPREF1544_10271 [Mucor circinelloides 1006PhL]